MVTRSAGLLLLAWALGGCAAAPRGAVASPEGEVLLADGSRSSWATLLQPGPTLAVFATPWCEVCRAERPAVVAWAEAHRGRARTLYVFSGGELPGALAQARALGLHRPELLVVVDADGTLADRFGVQATPTLLVLDAGGAVRSTHHRIAEVRLE